MRQARLGPVSPPQALNPKIKVVNLVSVIIAPLVVQCRELGLGGWLVVLVLVGVLAWAIMKSKKTAPEITVESKSS